VAVIGFTRAAFQVSICAWQLHSVCCSTMHATAACRCTSVWIVVAASAVHNMTFAAVLLHSHLLPLLLPLL
jgi:hypothetical protein